MSYKVKTDIFEGPFDLLVYLIENAEMSIYDIQVSEITTQYLEYLDKMKQADVVITGDFMVLAAALIEIKSKMLLPRMKPDGEVSAEEDPRSELVQRLLEYKKFKALAQLLEEEEEQSRKVFLKPQEDLLPFTKEPDELLSLDINHFVAAFTAFLNKKRKLEDIKKRYARVEREKMTVENRIQQIRNFFTRKKRVRFSELLEEKSRYHVVLTFMSMLELLKQKTINVTQHVNFGEITLTLAEEEEEESGNYLEAAND